VDLDVFGDRKETMTSLKIRTVSSVRWNALAQLVKLGFYLITSIILARLLQPEDFGLLGMATVFTSLVAVLNDFGLGSAVIQKTELDHKALSSVFIISVGFGVLATVITIFSAHWVAVFYQQEELQPLLYLLSLSFLITSLGQVQLSLQMKQINFKNIAIIETTSVFIGSLISILMAFLNQGVYSLVAQLILTSAIATLLLWLKSCWRPSLHFKIAHLRDVLGYSSGLFGFNILNFFSRNTDYLLIGKFLGAEPLGMYTFAYRLMQFPLQHIAGVVNRVLFPTLSQLQNNNILFRKGYIQASRLIALVTFPMMISVFALAQEIVLVFFGEKWKPSIPIIQALALVGLIQSVGGMVGNIYTAKGKTNWMFYWGLFSSFLTVSGIAYGLKWGVLGVGISYACISYLLFYPSLAIPFRMIDLRFSDYLRSFKTQGILSAIIGLIMIIISGWQRLAGFPSPIILVSNILLGSVIYLLVLLRYDRGIINDFFRAIFGKYTPEF
jgi:O-antigen/teichoic acid export membrane protein